VLWRKGTDEFHPKSCRSEATGTQLSSDTAAIISSDKTEFPKKIQLILGPVKLRKQKNLPKYWRGCAAKQRGAAASWHALGFLRGEIAGERSPGRRFWISIKVVMGAFSSQ